MDWSIPAGVATGIAAALSVSALTSTFISNYRLSQAERDLTRKIASMLGSSDYELSLSHLENLRDRLAQEFPDPETVAYITKLLASAAEALPDNEKRGIMSALGRGSEKSRANYAMRLIDEVEEARAS